jgi:hypothetical protein
MDVNLLKGRMAEAFVEDVFRQSRYKVCRLGRESQVERLLKSGKTEFAPDFFTWKSVLQPEGSPPLHRLLSVEVKYRASVADFLRRPDTQLLAEAGAQWPELHVVIVTDHPEPGRSCFQLLDLRQPDPAVPLATTDLHTAPGLGITEAASKEYEHLVQQIFGHLQEQAREGRFPRKPLAKVPPLEGLFLPERLSDLAF